MTKIQLITDIIDTSLPRRLEPLLQKGAEFEASPGYIEDGWWINVDNQTVWIWAKEAEEIKEG